MLIACYAYEGMYQGLHGIEDKTIIEAKDMEDARKQLYSWGIDASAELVYSYGLEEDYFGDDEECDLEDSMYWCDRGWYGHVIKEGKFASAQEAEAELAHRDYDSFVEDYCEKEAID